MIFNIRLIINTITWGLILLIFGLNDKKLGKAIVGATFIVIGIILNIISVFNGG